jgi:uncharacterized protein with HEPN domain
MTDKERIEHILENISIVEELIAGLDKDGFLRDNKVKYACYGNLVIISEAAARITKETKGNFEKIEWDLITGFRNFIIHEYFRVDWNIVWDVVEMNLPVLKNELSEII